MKTQTALSIAIALGLVQGGWAAPVSPARAVDGVSAWVARGPSSSRLPTGEVRTFSRDGIDYFHLVGLTGGGWVAMPADDAFSPVFAFDQSGELPDKDDGSPWWMSFALGCGMTDDGRSADARDFRFDVEATVLKQSAMLKNPHRYWLRRRHRIRPRRLPIFRGVRSMAIRLAQRRGARSVRRE